MDNIELLEQKLKEIEKSISKNLYRQSQIETLKKSNKSYCCKDVCSIINLEINSIETQLVEVDKLAYSRFPLFSKYFAKTTKPEGISRMSKQYSELVFKSNKDRQEFINHFYNQKKVKKIILKKDELIKLLNQIRNNDICECRS